MRKQLLHSLLRTGQGSKSEGRKIRQSRVTLYTMNKLSSIDQCLSRNRKMATQSVCLKHQQPVKSICTNHKDLIQLCDRCQQCCSHPISLLQRQIQLQKSIKHTVSNLTSTVDMFPLLSTHLKNLLSSIKKLKRLETQCQDHRHTITDTIKDVNIMQTINRRLQDTKYPDTFSRKERLLAELQPVACKIIKKNNNILSGIQKQLTNEYKGIKKTINQAVQLIDKYICSIDEDSIAVNSDEDIYHSDKHLAIHQQYAISIRSNNLMERVKRQLSKEQYDNYLLRQRVQFFEQQTAHRENLIQEELRNCMVLWYGNMYQNKQEEELKQQLLKVEKQYSGFLMEYQRQQQLVEQLGKIKHKNIQSTITDANWLRSNIRELHDVTCRIKYVASQHEFSTQKYHINCDGLRQFLVIIKTQSGLIIGGCVFKNTSYIFSVSREIVLKHLGKSPVYTCQNYYGPVFGMGDIRVTSDRVVSHNHAISRGYQMKNVEGVDQQDVLVLGGNQKLREYEVFELTDSVDAT